MEDFTPPSKEQIAFNEVWKRFVIEKRPAGMNEHNDCSWLTSDGNRCAVGWLIPSEMTKQLPCEESQSVSGVTDGKNKIAQYLRGTYSIEFLLELEIAHDTSAKGRVEMRTFYPTNPELFAERIEEKLRGMAASRGLQIPGKD